MTLLYLMYAFSVASIVTLVVTIHETALDISAAKSVKNGRLTIARVRMTRQVVLLLTVLMLATAVSVDVRRLVVSVCFFLLALSEVLLRQAFLNEAPPSLLVRLWRCLYGRRC